MYLYLELHAWMQFMDHSERLAATWVCRPQDLWESKDGFMHSLLLKLVIIKVEISITQAPFLVR
jgi:hypothetical protein